MGDRVNQYPKRREAVGRYLRSHADIPTLTVEPCGHINAPWGQRVGWVTSARTREVWARELRSHNNDEVPYFVVQRILDYDLDDSMVYLNLRHFAEILGGYYKSLHQERQEGAE